MKTGSQRQRFYCEKVPPQQGLLLKQYSNFHQDKNEKNMPTTISPHYSRTHPSSYNSQKSILSTAKSKLSNYSGTDSFNPLRTQSKVSNASSKAPSYYHKQYVAESNASEQDYQIFQRTSSKRSSRSSRGGRSKGVSICRQNNIQISNIYENEHFESSNLSEKCQSNLSKRSYQVSTKNTPNVSRASQNAVFDSNKKSANKKSNMNFNDISDYYATSPAKGARSRNSIVQPTFTPMAFSNSKSEDSFDFKDLKNQILSNKDRTRTSSDFHAAKIMNNLNKISHQAYYETTQKPNKDFHQSSQTKISRYKFPGSTSYADTQLKTQTQNQNQNQNPNKTSRSKSRKNIFKFCRKGKSTHTQSTQESSKRLYWKNVVL